jgi:sucrose-6F-phosphate phosphohydrolase
MSESCHFVLRLIFVMTMHAL